MIVNLIKVLKEIAILHDRRVTSVDRIQSLWKLSIPRTYEILALLKKHNIIDEQKRLNDENYITTLLIELSEKGKPLEIQMLSNNNTYLGILGFHLSPNFKSISDFSERTGLKYSTAYRVIKKLTKSNLVFKQQTLRFNSKSLAIKAFFNSILNHIWKQSTQISSIIHLATLGNFITDKWYISGNFALSEQGLFDETIVTGLREIIFHTPLAFKPFWEKIFDVAGYEIQFSKYNPNQVIISQNGLNLMKYCENEARFQSDRFPIFTFTTSSYQTKNQDIIYIPLELYPEEQNTISIGTTDDLRSVYIPLRTLTRHILIIGNTGSGKSNTANIIIQEASHLDVPSIVFDFYSEFTFSNAIDLGINCEDNKDLIKKKIYQNLQRRTIVKFEKPTYDISKKIIETIVDVQTENPFKQVLILFDSIRDFTSNILDEKELINIIRRGRKLGISLIITSQNLTSLPEMLFAQFNTVIAHRIISPSDIQLLKHIFGIDQYQIQQIRNLGVGQCMILSTVQERPIISVKKAS